MSDQNIPDWATRLTPADFLVEGPGIHGRTARSAAPRPVDDYDFSTLKYEITDLIEALCILRAEAEQFIEWRIGMGEGSGASWGLHQQTYSAELHLKHRALASKLKADCERRRPGNNWIEKVFSTPGRFGVEITLQAKKELFS
jgi:hypothetical protein